MLVFASLVAGCRSQPAPVEQLSAEATLGEKAFNDPALSASGRMSCATCHAPAFGQASPNALAVQFGGPELNQPGLRTSQPLRYLATNTAFHFDSEGKARGGFFWDGRADSMAQQAGGPLLSPFEMANADKAAVVRKIASAAWAADFKVLYGADVLNDTDSAFDKLTLALQRFQIEDTVKRGYTSKYDEVLRQRASLTVQEARGLHLFNDPAKGNCAACHTSEKGADGSPPLFTDFSYDNLGLPRNPEIPANADPKYFDLGLCKRAELRQRDELCGAFKVPSLRNVAQRQAYFHNGKFKTLKDAMTFYVERDTHPEKWYPRGPDGRVQKFNDLPARYHRNVNVSEVPYDRKRGEAPALNEAEIEDVIAFLQTLNDGWKGD
ncbi:MAG: cytochrome c peroxidase [Hylemonella sp.]|nr:cytochrome c peroxidase [Hylemonella sp.]